jgi:glycosyltransferase involved in cell wall biosynthesis
MTTRVLEIDLAERVDDQTGLSGYDRARVVLRYGRRVVGDVFVAIEDGLLLASDIRIAANEDTGVRERISQTIIEEHLRPDPSERALPSWTVVVCTRDRPEMLRTCLESLIAANDGSGGEIIVVDNDPSTDATELLVAQYPVRYVREERRGLNRARTLGAHLATGEIVIYTDDDTVADPGWIRALLEQFEGARVGAVTGLTMPFELETEAQEAFELYGGFGKGFRRRVFDTSSISPAGAGAVGSGASMAFRKDLIESMRLFEVELDLGTAARTGGDTYALYRVLAEGYRVVYTPDALNWHRHRRDRAGLRQTMFGYGTGLYAFLTKCLVEEKDLQALRVGLSWFRKHHLRQLLRTLARRPNHLPIDVVMAEIRGTLIAPLAYMRARRARPPQVPERADVLERNVA